MKRTNLIILQTLISTAWIAGLSSCDTMQGTSSSIDTGYYDPYFFNSHYPIPPGTQLIPPGYWGVPIYPGAILPPPHTPTRPGGIINSIRPNRPIGNVRPGSNNTLSPAPTPGANSVPNGAGSPAAVPPAGTSNPGSSTGRH